MTLNFQKRDEMFCKHYLNVQLASQDCLTFPLGWTRTKLQMLKIYRSSFWVALRPSLFIVIWHGRKVIDLCQPRLVMCDTISRKEKNQHKVLAHLRACFQNCEICWIVSDSLRKRFVKMIADHSDIGTKVLFKASL